MTHWEDVWSFRTARFTVTLSVTDEQDSPADHFESEDDIEFANEGGWHWFTARVQVSFGGRDLVLGEDYLGGCSYRSLADFTQPGGYFQDMVGEAISQARQAAIAIADSGIRAA